MYSILIIVQYVLRTHVVNNHQIELLRVSNCIGTTECSQTPINGNRFFYSSHSHIVPSKQQKQCTVACRNRAQRWEGFRKIEKQNIWVQVVLRNWAKKNLKYVL